MGKTKDARLRRIYKIGESEFNRVLKSQGNGCAICSRPFPKYMAFQDHYHGCCPRKKKEFCGKCNRGILCYICNKFVVGYMERQKINPNRLAAYMNKWNKVLTERGIQGLNNGK